MSSRYDVRIITTREGYNKLSQYMEDRFMEEDIYGESNPMEELDCYEKSKFFIAFGWNYIPYESEYKNYKILKQGLKLLEKEGHIYSVTKNVNIAEGIGEYRFTPPDVKDFKIPSVPLTYEFDDAETRILLKSMDDDYTEISNEMECDLE